MIQIYSTEVTSTTNQTVSWGNKAIQKGYSATLANDGQTINLNSPGIYEVSVNSYGTTTASGTYGFQLNGDGVEIARAVSNTASNAGESESIAFSTLIAVNRAYPYTQQASITLTYTGGAGTISLVNMTVKKVS